MGQVGGEDNIVMGTDYGHHDHAADLEGLQTLATVGAPGLREDRQHQPRPRLRDVGSGAPDQGGARLPAASAGTRRVDSPGPYRASSAFHTGPSIDH